MSRGSSRRLMPEPNRVAMECSSGADGGGGGLDGGDDVLVTGAAAVVPFDGVADLFVGGVSRVMLEEVDRRQDHPGSAETTLKPMLFPERILHRVQGVAPGQSLDRGDLAPLGLHGQHGTALHRAAVDQDGTGAALRGIAADMGAGEIEVVPERVDQ